MTPAWPQLRNLPCMAKLGIGMLVLIILGGLAASGAHLFFHDRNRDEQPDLTLTDIKGVYHGVNAKAPLLEALKRGHPETLSATERTTLIAWLESPRIVEDYDNLDLGDTAPNEIIAANCLSCHARKTADTNPIARTVPLDYLEDVKTVAFSKDIKPNDIKVLAASTHTHALSLATLSLVIAILLAMTAWPRGFAGFLAGMIGLGLILDLACWWIAREQAWAVYGVVAGGAAYTLFTALACLMILIDLFRRPTA